MRSVPWAVIGLVFVGVAFVGQSFGSDTVVIGGMAGWILTMGFEVWLRQ